tara:strand:+ start:1237 stop:2172 length:936 start_codon:yes stop_codon:yes gene_type:complete
MDIIHFKNEKMNDIIHYKVAEKIRLLLKNKEHPNLIIQGRKGSGKTKLITTIFNEIYGETKTITNDKLTIEENIFYYRIDCKIIINKQHCIDFIKELTTRYDHYNSSLKYIILENFNFLSKNTQNSLKVIMDKNYNNARFIILSNNGNNINRSIYNNSIMIRVPLPTKYDKYCYIKNILDKNKIIYNQNLLLSDCGKYRINVLIQLYIYHIEYNNIFYKTIDSVIQLVMAKKLRVPEIRDLAFTIKSLTMDISEILIHLVDRLSYYYQNKRNELIKEITNYEYIIQNSYREIIHIESLLIRIYKIINYELL